MREKIEDILWFILELIQLLFITLIICGIAVLGIAIIYWVIEFILNLIIGGPKWN